MPTVITRKSLKSELIAAIVMFAVITMIFFEIDFFDWWFSFTRSHEDWELDEYLGIVFAALLVGTIVAVRYLFVLSKLVDDLEAAQDELKKKAETQARQEKMAALGGLASGMAHEINNALQPVFGLGDFVRQGLQEGGNIKHAGYMDLILGSARHAREIIENVLTYARGKNIEKEILPALETLRQTIVFCQRLMPSSMSFDIGPDPDNISSDAKLLASRTGLFQIFANLFKNALQAAGEQGRITITFGRFTQPDTDKPMISVSVQDNGCGMEKETLVRIFDPFYSTKDASEGTGLGLAAVQGLMNIHGGFVTAESQPGQGSTSRLYFPITTGTA